MAEDEFLRVAEVAELLRLNPQTVRNTIARGDLRAVRFGRRVLIRRVDLDEYLVDAVKRSKPSAARTAFDHASTLVVRELREDAVPQASKALRELSAAALALAEELET
jgi:excisionase family DNA binding protein